MFLRRGARTWEHNLVRQRCAPFSSEIAKAPTRACKPYANRDYRMKYQQSCYAKNAETRKDTTLESRHMKKAHRVTEKLNKRMGLVTIEVLQNILQSPGQNFAVYNTLDSPGAQDKFIVLASVNSIRGMRYLTRAMFEVAKVRGLVDGEDINPIVITHEPHVVVDDWVLLDTGNTRIHIVLKEAWAPQTQSVAAPCIIAQSVSELMDPKDYHTINTNFDRFNVIVRAYQGGNKEVSPWAKPVAYAPKKKAPRGPYVKGKKSKMRPAEAKQAEPTPS